MHFNVALGFDAHIADRMRGGIGKAVNAPVADTRLHTGEKWQVQINLRKCFPAQIFGHCKGPEFRAAPRATQQVFLLAVGEIKQLGKLGNRGVKIAGLFGYQDNLEVLVIIGQLDFIAVENLPPRGRHQPDVYAIVFGKRGIKVAARNLKILQTPGQQ